MDYNDLIEIRKHLHKNPELSGNENETSEFIISELNKLNPDKIIKNIGGYGIAAIFYGIDPELTIGFRSELDALPIKETNDFEHISLKAGVSHKCGHDGHMTNLLAFADKISKVRNKLKNTIIILFQPAEETAQGAKAIINDEKFSELKIDYLFALHNLPGYPLRSILIKEEEFASASTGVIFKLSGKTSHAAHPENGINPVNAMTNIINGLLTVPSLYTNLKDASNITIIHAQLGEIAFGTSPGDAVVMATLRAHKNEIMDILKTKSLELAQNIAKINNLKFEYEWVEDFAATVNENDAYIAIKDAANRLEYKQINIDNPFPWSEDFGFYSEKIKTGFFGVGAGEEHPQLHNPDYDYPDDIIEISANMFYNIVQHFEK